MTEHDLYWQRYRETMGLTQLEDLQDEKLQQKVYEFYNAPVIRDLWDEASISPDDVQTTANLAEAPVFRKADIREYVAEGDSFGGRLNKPFATLAEKHGYVGTTSGTTGRPSNIMVTEADREIASTWAARHLWTAGLRPEDVLINILPTREIVLDTFTRGAHKMGALTSDVFLGPSEGSRVVHLVQSLEPTVLFVIASPMVDAIQQHCKENDLDPREVFEPVKTAIFAGEPLVEGYREEIERQFGIDVLELGGSIEPRWTAMGCGEDPGWLHLPDDHFFAEVVDPETDERVDEDERGELVITPLSYEGMSHLRWGTDDIVKFKRGTCGCGRTGTRLNIRGRVDDTLCVDGQNVLPLDVLQIVDGVEEMPGNFFQLYPSSEDEGVIKLRLGYDEELTDDPDMLATEVRSLLETDLSLSVEIVETLTEEEIRNLGPQVKVPRIVPE
jgi:phenylacetate-CoA ligase